MASSAPFPLAAAAGAAPLLLRQLFDAETGTFTYLLAEVASRQGVLIDSVYEQHPRDLSLIRELGIDLVACLDTHVHADHVTGSWRLQRATGCAIGLAAQQLQKKGLTRVANLRGGLRAWKAQGLPLEHP
jgi:glyoxylase-like metal-dependent hydrolase (beta-lactamase superfamily II)